MKDLSNEDIVVMLMFEQLLCGKNDLSQESKYKSELLSHIAAGEKAVKKVAELKSMSTVEMMCENESVRQHITEWEARCRKAEEELSELYTRHTALCALYGTKQNEARNVEKSLRQETARLKAADNTIVKLKKQNKRKADLFAKKCFECSELLIKLLNWERKWKD
jgi:hypothetical protein